MMSRGLAYKFSNSFFLSIVSMDVRELERTNNDSLRRVFLIMFLIHYWNEENLSERIRVKKYKDSTEKQRKASALRENHDSARASIRHDNIRSTVSSDIGH